MPERKPLSPRTRFEVFKRDTFACIYCGRTPPAVTLEVDHVLAVANGGTNAKENLVTSCRECNRGKAAVPLDQVPQPLAVSIEEQKERRKQVNAYNRWLRKARAEREAEVEALGNLWFEEINSETERWVFGFERARKVEYFLERLPGAVVESAIFLARARVRAYRSRSAYRGPLDDEGRWKYFCKVCWNQIKGEREPL